MIGFHAALLLRRKLVNPLLELDEFHSELVVILGMEEVNVLLLMLLID
jgi:hypothetical protein